MTSQSEHECRHWRPSNIKGGACSLGLFGGFPSMGTCLACGDRDPGDPGERSPILQRRSRIAPALEDRVCLNLGTCSACNHYGGQEGVGHSRCLLVADKAIPAWQDDMCPSGLWKAAHARSGVGDLGIPTEPDPAQTIFLLCGGPSLADLDLDELRLLHTAGVNNTARVFMPDLWFCVDDPLGFNMPAGFWSRPHTTKFIPNRYHTSTRPYCPSVKGVIPYNETMSWEWSKYLSEERVLWGVSVMFAAIRVLFHLGIRRIFLLGCDLHMDKDRPYAADEPATDLHVRSNNRAYEDIKTQFQQIRGLLEDNGMHLFNCNPDSKLTIFPFMAYNQALSLAKQESVNALLGPNPTIGPSDGPPGGPAQRNDVLDVVHA